MGPPFHSNGAKMKRDSIIIEPKWKGVLLLLLASYKDGDDKTRKDALAELYRMAEAADRYNEQVS